MFDDAPGFPRDPLGLTHLLRHGDPNLVHQLEDGPLVDDDVVRERYPFPGGDQHLEALDEEEDVRDMTSDGGCRRYYTAAALSYNVIPRLITAQEARRRSPSARATPAGTMADTSPPKVAISLARVEDT